MALFSKFFPKRKNENFGLKGYKTLVENAIYAENERVVMASRHYKMPNKSIVKYLQNNARKLLQNHNDGNIDYSELW